MELDIENAHFDREKIKARHIEEALEDPFIVRFLPDVDRADGQSRFYALGRSVADQYLFLCFSSDGKVAHIVTAREMSEGERKFYDRKYAKFGM